MANMVSNYLLFTNGNLSIVIPKICKEIDRYDVSASDSNLHFGTDSDYLYDINFIDDNAINYETKWKSNIGTLLEDAKIDKFSFELESVSIGDRIYEKHFYNHETGEHSVYFMTDEEFDYIIETEDGLYSFEGDEYESEEDICEIIVRRKIENKS